MKLPHAPKICIARGDVLGDTVVTTALIQPILEAFPEAEISYLVQGAYQKLLSHHPAIKRCITDPFEYADTPENKPHFKPLIKELKSHNFDVFIAVWENPRYAYCAAKAGIPVRIGHAQGFKNKRYLTHPVKSNFLDYVRHKVEVNAALLKPLGIFDAHIYPVDLHTDPEITAALQVTHPWMTKDYIAIHLDAGHPQRILKTEHFIPIVQHALDQDKTVVLFGRAHNQVAAKQIISTLKAPGSLINLIDQVSLDQLMHVIANAKLLIGSDSGPVHLASGFAVPVLVYYFNRIQNAFHWGPWKTPHLIVKTRHDCIDVCNPTSCDKTSCKDTVEIAEFKSGITQLLEDNEINKSNQRQYWSQKMLCIALFGPNKEALLTELSPYYWSVKVIDERKSLGEQVKQLAEGNCNLLCYTNSITPTLSFLKLKILSHWVSNYVTLFPKMICAASHFECEAKVSFLYQSETD